MQRYDIERALYRNYQAFLAFIYQPDDPTSPAAIQQASNPNVSPIIPAASTPTDIYTDPLCFAARQLGYMPSNPLDFADADAARIPNSRAMDFVDLAGYRLLGNMLNNFVDTDESADGISQSWNAMAQRIQDRYDKLGASLAPLLTSQQYELGFSGVRLPYQERAFSGWEYGDGYAGW